MLPCRQGRFESKDLSASSNDFCVFEHCGAVSKFAVKIRQFTKCQPAYAARDTDRGTAGC